MMSLPKDIIDGHSLADVSERKNSFLNNNADCVDVLLLLYRLMNLY